MPLTETEKDWLEGFFEHMDGREKELSAWARGFLADQVERYGKYGINMRLSPKQWDALNRSAADLGYDGPSVATHWDGAPPGDDSEIPF